MAATMPTRASPGETAGKGVGLKTRVPTSATNRVVVNTFWLVLDNTFGLAGGIVASILVARHFGPALLGAYAFISVLALLTGALAGRSGMMLVSRKLVAETLERRDYAATNQVLRQVNRLQALIASAAVGLGLAASILLVERQYLLVATFAVVSLFPNLMLAVSTGANAAVDDFRAIVGIGCSERRQPLGLADDRRRRLEWLACSLLASRTVDWLVRRIPAADFRRWLGTSGLRCARPEIDLRRQISVVRQTAVIQVLDLLVLDAQSSSC
jgi:hypothetical protein